MASELVTQRLTLRALSAYQLGSLLRGTSDLHTEIGLPLSPDITDANVERAIGLKLAKMREVEAGLHDWYTYWLIIIRSVPVGTGMIGFKGVPDAAGSTEIGYGISARYRNLGYMTEALFALSAWAFGHEECRELTAQTVANPASEHVLSKAGWEQLFKTDDSSDWILNREKWRLQAQQF
jgi:ribosomal-protein-alanine N-acetyltransferase